MLEKAGYLVLSAYDGEEGLKLIKENSDTALVLLDVMLPKMHGIEVLREAKKDELSKKTEIVLLSNLGDESIIQESISLGARDYLRKVNITPRDLVNLVEKYLTDKDFVIGISSPAY